MLKLNANVYSCNLWWLGFYGGRFATLTVSATAEDVTDIIKRCDAMVSALEKEAPASASSMSNVVANLQSGTTTIGLQRLLDRISTTLNGELAQRSMWIMMPGEKPVQPLSPQAAAVPSATLPAPASSPGGRPAKPWWEDLLIEITRQIWVGALNPEKQVDIENAMHEWIAAQGHTAGETPVRDRARKLFNALTK